MLAPEVFITCAVTGSADSVRKNPKVPVTPAQIAESALDAHAAGAAIVHLHVRDPQSGLASRDPALFREVVDRIRSRNRSVILNLTGGMGGGLLIRPEPAPLDFPPGPDCRRPQHRHRHLLDSLRALGTLDVVSSQLH